MDRRHQRRSRWKENQEWEEDATSRRAWLVMSLMGSISGWAPHSTSWRCSHQTIPVWREIVKLLSTDKTGQSGRTPGLRSRCRVSETFCRVRR